MTVRGDTVKPAATAAEEGRWRIALWAVFAVTVVRLVWLATGQADLYPDEAQYWFWSLHPAWGYYSKPPLVAWLIALTTGVFGEDELAVRLAAPLLHFGTSLVVFALARRLYDGRVAMWSAIAYATLPGVSASALILSTDAPLLFCWAVALYAFLRAREPGGGRWWIAVGVAAGVGLLAKYAMAYWLLSALLYLLLFRDERRHLKPFLGATVLALLVYAPNFAWNAAHGFVSYHHTRDNAALAGSLFHPEHFLEFLGSQFAVFGPLLFVALILVTALGRRSLADRPAALLACFALPTLAMMLVVSFLSRAQPNWSAPTFVAAVVLVVAWLLARGWQVIVTASIVLHVAAAVILLEARDAVAAVGLDLPAKYDVLHRLRGWKQLGHAVGNLLLREPGTVLMSDDREDMAALLYYVHPHPLGALKWNGEGGIHDQFDLTADPARYIGADFLLVTHTPDNVDRILRRFDGVLSIDRITIPLSRHPGEARSYTLYRLHGFKGYAEASPPQSE
jgi:4-amino-4-deoxy-L-arabinose transferase-like glycosyltransferase